MQFQDDLAAGIVLVRPALQSPDYNPGVAGWTVNIDGSAEFNNLVLRGTFHGSGFIMNSDGVFIYNGAPAAGNLIANIAANSGTDGFGNAYLAGVVSYNGTEFASLFAGNVLFGGTSSGYNPAGGMGNDGVDGISITSPSTPPNTDVSSIALFDGLRTVTPVSAAGYPHLLVYGTVWCDGPAIHATNNANTWTAETWHTPAFSGTWSSTGTLNGNSTFRGLQYRKDAEDNVWVLGAATTTGAGGSIFTLPSGYFNTSKRALLPCFIFHSGTSAVSSGFAQVTEAGVVNIAASLAGVTIGAGDQVFINGKFPLGNVS